MPFYFCEDCIKNGISARYEAKYPIDYKVTIMCSHWYDVYIKPKLPKKKVTKENIKKPT